MGVAVVTSVAGSKIYTLGENETSSGLNTITMLSPTSWTVNSGFYHYTSFKWFSPKAALTGGATTTIPVVGHWSGSGKTTIGVYDPNSYTWLLRNSNTPGAPDYRFQYGYAKTIPVVGDWNGDGTTTIGVYDPNSYTWLLRNSNTPGAPDYSFQYGYAKTIPVVGDWNGDGTTTIGLYDPNSHTWLLRNSNTPGRA